MNIFKLDNDIIKCAEYHCDKHVVKMIIESCQMLTNAFTLEELKSAPKTKLGEYRKHSYLHHPCSKWVINSYDNFIWLYNLTYYLLGEYTLRYSKEHFCYDFWLWVAYEINHNKKFIKRFKHIRKTPFALAMPNKYKFCKFCEGSGTDLIKYEFTREIETCSHCKGKGKLSAVEAYRAYYCGSKLYNKNGKPNKWTKREIPPFIKKYLKNAKKEGITQ